MKLGIKPVPGLKLVLEKTGTEIEDDDILQYYASKDYVFQLLDSGYNWTSAPESEGENNRPL